MNDRTGHVQVVLDSVKKLTVKAKLGVLLTLSEVTLISVPFTFPEANVINRFTAYNRLEAENTEKACVLVSFPYHRVWGQKSASLIFLNILNNLRL